MKPEWKDAPEWAKWLVRDRNGTWCFCEEKPVADKGMGVWDVNNRYHEIPHNPVINWQDTLEQRPEA